MADEEEPKVNLQPDGSKVDSDNNDEFGSSVDGSASFAHNKMMDIDSPSSELEHLTGDVSESDNDSIKSGQNGMYEVNPEKHETENKENENVPSNMNSNENSDTNAGSESSEPKEKKAKTRRMTDSFLSKKASGRTSPRLNDSLPNSRPASAASSSKSGAKEEKDPAKREKEREKEEQIRLRQLHLAEERQRKIEEMKEQQRLAQEKREKQLELRRKKIEESKRKDAERRKEVEERRMQQEMLDKAKKEAMLSKAKERLTRYEQWKSHGRKGYPFGYSPPSKSLSMSTSVLYQKSSPEFSSTGTLNTTASGGLKSGAESMIASAPPTRHKSSVNLGSSFSGVKMRDPNKMSPRKPRPSSVATSMPSFVKIDTSDSPKGARSKSTDRSTREHSKTRVPGHKDDKADGQEKRAATLPRPYDRKKIEERRQEIKRKTEERKEKEIEKQERMTKSDIQEEKKDKAQVRMSRSFIERMAVPKRNSPDKKETVVKESSGVKVIKKTGVVEAPKASNQKAKAAPKDKPKVLPDSPSKSALKSSLRDTKAKDDSSSTRSESPKSLSPAPSGTPPARNTPTIQGEDENRGMDETDSPDISFDESSKEHSAPSQPTVTFAEPELMCSPRHKPVEVKQDSPEPKGKPESKPASASDSKPKTDKEREMEEYKAKLAEKRRLAREKAEREAEIERLRQEEEQRQEEERQRLEEERQRQEEEEALRIAEESRKAEEERLQKAIEAEERRKKEEAERLEQERIAKEEADKKAKEEAERLEKERQERAKREEEERVERKKRLEMIMKRVKTGDTPTSTPEKRTESPTLLATGSSSRTSLVSSEDERGDDSEKDEGSDSGLKPEMEGQKFKSPLLQKLTETKQNGDSGAPKFKSPLLQSIMGKTKLGARLSGSKLNEMGKSEENLAKSDDENLAKSDDNMSETETDKPDVESEQIIITVDTSEEKEDSAVEETEASQSEDKEASNGINVSSIDKCQTEESLLTEESRVDIDSHEVSGETVIDAADKLSVSDQGVTDSLITVGSTADSAVSLSFNGVSSTNGDVHIEPRELIDSKELVDSSISMRTADSFGSSQTGSMGGSLVESQTVTASDSSQFEEIIDLNVTNKTLKTQQFTDNLLNHSEDLLNLNNIPVDSLDNNHMTAGGDADSLPVVKPFIAFEDNATRRQDVTDLLS